MTTSDLTPYNIESATNDESTEEVPLFHMGVKTNPNPNQKFKTKQRTLVFSQRKVKPKLRHLMNNVRELLPHSKGCEKHDTSRHDSLDFINDLCMSLNCSNAMFFQQVGTQPFMYMSKSPSGPTVKFRLHNISTMQELRMTGNCLKGSRPLLHFDKQFDSSPKWKLLKELYTQMFSTPHKHPKSKPFVDHVFGFYIAEDKIWFRNYQILMRQQKQGQQYELVEIGPRFVMEPLRIISGSFKGEIIYNADNFVSKELKQKIQNEEYKAKRVKHLQAQAQKVALLTKEKDSLNAVFDDAQDLDMSDVDEGDLTD